MRMPAVALLLLGLSCRPAAGPSPGAAASPNPTQQQVASPPAAMLASSPKLAEVTAVVAAFRQVVVLMEAEPALPEADRERARLVGWRLADQNNQRLATLAERIAQSVAQKDWALPRAFLDALERDPDLRDADKLAFLDVVLDLRSDLAELSRTKDGDELLARLDEDRQALAGDSVPLRPGDRAFFAPAGTDRAATRELGRLHSRAALDRRRRVDPARARLACGGSLECARRPAR